MSISSLLQPFRSMAAHCRWTAADLGNSPEADLFSSNPRSVRPSAVAAKPKASAAEPVARPSLTIPPSPPSRFRWIERLRLFRWLPLGNRRRKSTRPWVQTEMLLQETKPLRHDLTEEDVALVRRQRPVLIYESRPAAEAPRRFDTERAYARLRNRAPLADRIVTE